MDESQGWNTLVDDQTQRTCELNEAPVDSFFFVICFFSHIKHEFEQRFIYYFSVIERELGIRVNLWDTPPVSITVRQHPLSSLQSDGARVNNFYPRCFLFPLFFPPRSALQNQIAYLWQTKRRVEGRRLMGKICKNFGATGGSILGRLVSKFIISVLCPGCSRQLSKNILLHFCIFRMCFSYFFPFFFLPLHIAHSSHFAY